MMFRQRQSKFSGTQSHGLFGAILWVVFFCYSICAALIFQKLLLPLVPSLHAVGSNLSNDAAYFDSVAVALADAIQKHGWSSWQLFPAANATGSVAILGALYVIFGHDPALAIPLNAAIHALGGVLIFLLAFELAPSRVIGGHAGVIAATFFITFPSALNWYGQIHKDGYAIAATLFLLLIWVRALQGSGTPKFWFALTMSNLAGVAFLASVRPYSLKIIFLAMSGMLIVFIVVPLLRHGMSARSKASISFFLMVLVSLWGGDRIVASWDVAPISASAQLVASAKNSILSAGAPQMGSAYPSWEGDGSWQWRNSPWLPAEIETPLEVAARARAGLIDYARSARSNSLIDGDVTPKSAGEVIAYLPRALEVALLAPFPSSWTGSASVTRLVAAGEMLVFYFCLPGIFFLWRYNKKPVVLLSLYFAGTLLLMHGFTVANMGTLYRLRYGYMFIMLLLGVVGWITLLEKKIGLAKIAKFFEAQTEISNRRVEIDDSVGHPSRKEVVSASFLVMGLTFLGFAGFFLRDVLMAQSFGLGAELDDFFVALMTPMFIVTVLCMPFGTAFVPFYTSLKDKLSSQAMSNLVSRLSTVTIGVLFLGCLLLYLSGPHLLAYLHITQDAQDFVNTTRLAKLALPILLLGGLVILGNATLSAAGATVLPSGAQLAVPVVSITFLLVFGGQYGATAVMWGMVVGQALNLLIVQFYLKKVGVSLIPRFGKLESPPLVPLLGQYFPLVASAFFSGVALPVDTLLATTLSEGSVAAFSLGNKVVLFMSGLIGAAISSVMLPYFSALVERNQMVSARRELSLFLLLVTFISVLGSALLFVWSEPLVRLIFERGTFNRADVAAVSRVMQYAIIQLPFFASNALMLKYATATRHMITVTVVALMGLVINVSASLVLIPYMGVAGIALGASLSMLVATALLVMVMVKFGHITGLDAVVVMLNWLLFVTLVVSVHFQSVPSIVMTIFTYAILLAVYVKTLKQDKPC